MVINTFMKYVKLIFFDSNLNFTMKVLFRVNQIIMIQKKYEKSTKKFSNLLKVIQYQICKASYIEKVFD